jgi:uncharacterized protein YraI
MSKHRSVLLALAAIIIVACSCPLVGATGVTPTIAAPTTAVVVPDVATQSVVASPTSTQTTSPLLSVPLAAPNGQPVNCRSGPGMTWSVTTILQPGQTAEIVGKTVDGTWLEVKSPTLGNNLCWVSTSVVTTTGNLGGIQVAAGPPTPTGVPTSAVGTVTNISVSVAPSTIGVAGCMGPIQPSTVSATITVSGPAKLVWHFESQQRGNLGKHTQNFTKAGSKEVSSTFTPPLTAGTYRVELFIDGVDLGGFDTIATYTIHC